MFVHPQVRRKRMTRRTEFCAFLNLSPMVFVCGKGESLWIILTIIF
jgi:hypothetical protein